MVEKKSRIMTLLSGLKRAAGDPVDRLCDILSVVGIGALGLGVTGGITLSVIGISNLPLVTFVIPTLWYVIAYLLQSILLAAIGKKRESDYSWEGTAKYFVFKQAVPVLLVCVIGILLSRSLWFEYYRQLMLKGALSSFDEYSIQPVVSLIASFAMMGLGIRSAFFPGNQLMSIRRVITASLTCFLVYALLLVVNAGAPERGFTLMFSLCFMVYITCAVIIMNQSVVVRKSLGTTVAKIGPNARIYDMKMVLLWMLGTAFAGIFAYILVSGLWYILRFVVLVALWAILSRTRGSHEQLSQESIAETVLGEESFSGVMAIIATLVVIMLTVLTIIFIRSVAVQAIFEAIKSWIESVIAMIMGKDSYIPESEINYRDEIEMLTVPKAVRRIQFTSKRGKTTLRDFRNQLEKLPFEEKLTYSYVVMIELLRELNPALAPSCTPEELARKIRMSTSVENIDEITRAVELVSYAERTPSAEASKTALDAITAVIEKRLG